MVPTVSVSITKKGRLGSYVSTQRWPETPLGKGSAPDRPVLPGRREELRSGSPQFLTVVAGLGGWLESWKEQDQKVADTGMDKLSRWVQSLKIPTSLGTHTIRLWIMSFAQNPKAGKRAGATCTRLHFYTSWKVTPCNVFCPEIHGPYTISIKFEIHRSSKKKKKDCIVYNPLALLLIPVIQSSVTLTNFFLHTIKFIL